MNGPKKGGLAILIGSPHHMAADDGDGEEQDGDDNESAMHDGASALIDAVHSKDVDGVVQALKTLHMLCSASSDDGDEGKGY